MPRSRAARQPATNCPTGSTPRPATSCRACRAPLNCRISTASSRLRAATRRYGAAPRGIWAAMSASQDSYGGEATVCAQQPQPRLLTGACLCAGTKVSPTLGDGPGLGRDTTSSSMPSGEISTKLKFHEISRNFNPLFPDFMKTSTHRRRVGIDVRPSIQSPTEEFQSKTSSSRMRQLTRLQMSSRFLSNP